MAPGRLTTVALVATIVGPLGFMLYPWFIQLSLGVFLNLNENGLLFPDYMNPPFSTITSYYVYEVKNPKVVLQGGKMLLGLKGPFLYDAYLKRDNISFSLGGERVRFSTQRKLVLREDKTAEAGANLDEKFWVINAVLPVTLANIKTMFLDRVPFSRLSEPILFRSVNVLLDQFNERLIFKRSPRELLEGKKIELLAALVKLAESLGIAELIPQLRILPDSTFGVAFFQNNLIDTSEIWTGVGKSKEKFGDVYKWKDKSQITLWEGKCNEISGTNGELHKPNLVRGKAINVFFWPICRSFTIDPVNQHEQLVPVQSNVMTLEFEISPKLFLGAQNNPNNMCYCKDKKSYDCLLDGFINMGPCYFDVPLFFSKANFVGVDQRIRSLIDEASFNYDLPTKQSFYIEPATGATLKANITLLAAYKIVRQDYMRDMAKIQELTYAPAFVATELIMLPTYVTLPLKGLQLTLDYHRPFYLLLTLCGILILLLQFVSHVFGVVLFAGGGGKKRKKQAEKKTTTESKTKPLESESEASTNQVNLRQTQLEQPTHEMQSSKREEFHSPQAQRLTTGRVEESELAAAVAVEIK